MKPIDFASGVISLISATWSATGDMSDMPVTLPPGLSMSLTSCAPTGSETAVKTTGMSRVEEMTAWAEGVEIGTMTVGSSPTNWRAICAAVPGLPCADS